VTNCFNHNSQLNHWDGILVLFRRAPEVLPKLTMVRFLFFNQILMKKAYKIPNK